MATSFGCTCDIKDKRNWRVAHRNHNHSYFEAPKGQAHLSAYSTVFCLKCGAFGRTKAQYVYELADCTEAEYLSLIGGD